MRVDTFAAAMRRAQFAVGTGRGRRVILADGWQTADAFIVKTADPFIAAAAAQPHGLRKVVRVDRETGMCRVATYKQLEAEIVVAEPTRFRHSR
ncbi:hypothetical protein R4227_06010 [Gordonia amicalis]|uniref:hypothetical protein n=1 Tax=Gordonia amicalis TaxID=89053 RepID=UPI0029542BA9|nr:hypothetical protein [Gordonia amicalis]MDV7099696.1 hypothetical protein [Gordonia amicalis]